MEANGGEARSFQGLVKLVFSEFRRQCLRFLLFEFSPFQEMEPHALDKKIRSTAHQREWK